MPPWFKRLNLDFAAAFLLIIVLIAGAVFTASTLSKSSQDYTLECMTVCHSFEWHYVGYERFGDQVDCQCARETVSLRIR